MVTGGLDRRAACSSTLHPRMVQTAAVPACLPATTRLLVEEVAWPGIAGQIDTGRR